MRKLYPLIFLLSSVITFSHAQNPTPNPGFEYWDDTTVVETFLVPRDWTTLNPETGLLGVLTCLRCDTSHSGNYAVELVTDSIQGEPPVNGIITTGIINIVSQNITGGILFNLRPDSIYGWYKYFPAKGDSTEIEFGLYDNSGNLVGLASVTTGNVVPTYTRFSAPVIYYTNATPDTSQWIISSSNGHNSHIGSRLYVDDIGLIGAGAGIPIPAFNPITITVLPNPASDFIIVSNPNLIQGVVSLYNDAGAEVKQFQLNSDKQNLDVHDLASGHYLYSITNTNGNRLANGTIILK